MGMDFEQVLRVDDYGVHARDVIRTAELSAGFAVDVTELRELLDMLGIFGPEQCAGHWHLLTNGDQIVHYMTPQQVENAERGQPADTLCSVFVRHPELVAIELREDCTDADLRAPHCIWCVIRAGVLS